LLAAVPPAAVPPAAEVVPDALPAAALDARTPDPGDAGDSDLVADPENDDGGAYDGPEYEPERPGDAVDPADPLDPADPADVGDEGRVDVPDGWADCDEE
jgi:hypothetical protein